MDFSDIGRSQREPGPRRGSEASAHALVAQLGSEVAAVVSSALERVNTLAATGRIDRVSLRALREELELARRIGIMGQQVSRFALGRVQLAQERIDLTAMLRDALVQRGRELEARGILVRQVLAPACVLADATLLFSLLQALLDWAFEHTCARVDLAIEVNAWPVHAQLSCAFTYLPPDEVTSAPMPLEARSVDSMAWRLVAQAADTLGLLVTRHDQAGRAQVNIEFQQTVQGTVESADTLAFDDMAAQANNSKPLAGSHVLVVAGSREVRNLVRQALRPMGLMVDYVTTVQEAVAFCRGGVPHAIVHEASLGGERFEQMRRELRAEVATLAFIQIAADGRAFEVLNVGDCQFASVGRDALLESLPAALMFELARSK